MGFDELVSLTSSENWDQEGAPAISAAEWDVIRAFTQACTALAPGNGPAHGPSYSACGDGSPHVRWSTRDAWIEVEQIRGAWSYSRKIGDDVTCVENLTPGGALDATLHFLRRIK